MTTCFLMIPPNGFVSAMSCRDIGGNGPPPRDTNQIPSHERVQSVRRRLFGDVDHQQTRLDLEHQLTRCEERDRNKYNFDFITQQPISSSDSRYEWSHISAQDDTNPSIDTNDTTFDSKLPQEFSTKLCKASDQSSTQSQSATTSTTTCTTSSTTSSTPPPLQSLQPLPTCGPTLASSPTSGALSPDSQPQASSSSEALTARIGHKSPTVVHSKQTKITEYYSVDGRKSALSQRKRSAAQVMAHKDSPTKRQRLECTSAVVPEESDTRVSEDSSSTETTGTSV